MITMMEFIVFTIIICAEVAFIAILYAWENSRTLRTLRTTFTLFLLWIVGEFIVAQISDVSWRLWIQRATGAIGLSTAWFFTRFAYALRYKKYDRYFYAFAIAVTVASLLYLATDLGIESVTNVQRYQKVYFGKLFWIIVSLTVANWAFNVWVMHQAMKELPGYESARRASIALIQIATTVLSAVGIAGFILSALFWEKNIFFRYVPLLTVIFVPFFMVALYRYGFLTTGIERLARDLFKNALDGIIVTDETNVVRQINPSALKLLNIKREDAEGIPVARLLYLTDKQRMDSRFELAPGDIPRLRHHLSVSITPVVSHSGFHQNLVMLMDMTDEKAAEESASKSKEEFEHEILMRTEELIELQEKEAVGAMAGSIAHDFNNLLAAVLGFATAAYQDVPEGDPLKTDLEEILSSARQARSVVQQLLLFSRRQKSKRMRMDASEMLKSALSLIATSLPPNVRLSHMIPDSPLFVMANRTDLSQVLMNLCSNAVQAIDDNDGTIAVTLEMDAEPEVEMFYMGEKTGHRNVRLSVRDTGPGISDEMKPLVFEPFFSTRENAIGFGLSTAFRIASENAGGISIQDNSPAGAIVSVWLPRLDMDTGSDNESTKDLSGGEHILVVDDDERLLRLMVRLLNSVGYRVTTFNDPDDALTAFRRTPGAFDLLITDFAMPHMSGAELGQRIIEERTDLPVLLISGNATDDDVEMAKSDGINAYLSKPFTREEFLQVVRNILNEFARPSVIP